MNKRYFEDLHRAEARYAEWRMLDQSLTNRRHASKLRVVLGHWMIQAGARIAGESDNTLLSTTAECRNCSPRGY